jgi:hypothetical protein
VENVRVTELLRYDEDTAFGLADDAATVSAIARRVPLERLRGTTFGEWTAVDIIGHLADAAEIFAERVRRCLDEDTPTLASYDQDAVAAERHDRRDPLADSRMIQESHGVMVRLLQRPGAASRPAMHSQWGKVDAGHIAAYQAKHSHEHTLDLQRAFPPA